MIDSGGAEKVLVVNEDRSEGGILGNISLIKYCETSMQKGYASTHESAHVRRGRLNPLGHSYHHTSYDSTVVSYMYHRRWPYVWVPRSKEPIVACGSCNHGIRDLKATCKIVSLEFVTDRGFSFFLPICLH